jgi:hypothetical protein
LRPSRAIGHGPSGHPPFVHLAAPGPTPPLLRVGAASRSAASKGPAGERGGCVKDRTCVVCHNRQGAGGQEPSAWDRFYIDPPPLLWGEAQH